MNALSTSEIESLRASFSETGYLIFKGIVSKDKLSALRDSLFSEFERSERSGELFSGGGRISGHLNCFPGEESRFAYETLREAGIIDLIAAINPRAVGAPSVGCNMNLPNSKAQHYHADGWYTGEFMIANVAVVDTVIANGAIDVLPKTHKKFYKFWRYALERAYTASTRLPLEQGDVLIRTSNLWHRGMPNQTSTARPMLAFTFGEKAPPNRPEDPFTFNGGKISFHANWYRPTLLGRMRERTFVAAPITYSAYRFVRSLVGSKGFDSA
jgi:Phytanoyl-CoA dioxygenase (PhyH)